MVDETTTTTTATGEFGGFSLCVFGGVRARPFESFAE